MTLRPTTRAAAAAKSTLVGRRVRAGRDPGGVDIDARAQGGEGRARGEEGGGRILRKSPDTRSIFFDLLDLISFAGPREATNNVGRRQPSQEGYAALAAETKREELDITSRASGTYRSAPLGVPPPAMGVAGSKTPRALTKEGRLAGAKL